MLCILTVQRPVSQVLLATNTRLFARHPAIGGISSSALTPCPLLTVACGTRGDRNFSGRLSGLTCTLACIIAAAASITNSLASDPSK